jgi:ferredoxin
VLVIVDLKRCESHGQCILAAPEVFHDFDDESVLLYDGVPDESLRSKVEDAARACPTGAIEVVV